jgi:hypothetical protein
MDGYHDCLPARGRAREYERKALRIRRFAGVGEGAALDPFALAARIGLRLVGQDLLNRMPEEVRRQLLVKDAAGWSGSVTGLLPDGGRLVVLNPVHSRSRQTATLMEEICHVLLGHRTDRLDYGTKQGRIYDVEKESEAYGVGAAALVPFHVLKRWLECETEISAAGIGRRYGVSRALVEYRMRIVGLSAATDRENLR